VGGMFPPLLGWVQERRYSSPFKKISLKIYSSVQELASHARGELAGNTAAGGRHRRYLERMTSQSMCTYLKSNPTEFHPDPI